MNFEYLKPETLGEAFHALDTYENAKIYAGGSDLLWQIRSEAVEVGCIVDLKAVRGMNDILQKRDSIEIGALTTLRDIENSALLQKEFSALSEAAKTVASQKLRNRATLAGNLCQRVKCPYFNQSHINLYMRESLSPCYKRKGRVCHAAVYGRDVLHIITGKGACKAPAPSDTAVALAAFGAIIEIHTKSGERDIAVSDFYRSGDSTLNTNEIVTKIKLTRRTGLGSAFRCCKLSPGSFAIVSAAAAVEMEADGRHCKNLTLYLGGVAQKPYAAEIVQQLLNSELTEKEIAETVKTLFTDVEITNDEVLFKVAKARALCREALIAARDRAMGGNKA